MKIVFNKQKDPSGLMFINNMPIKIRQKHLTQQSKTVPSNFERSPEKRMKVVDYYARNKCLDWTGGSKM